MKNKSFRGIFYIFLVFTLSLATTSFCLGLDFKGNPGDPANGSSNKRNPKINNELIVYPALHENQFRSDLYEVTVKHGQKGLSSYVYTSNRFLDEAENKYKVLTTDANHWTSFSFSGTVTVEIKMRDGSPIKSAIVHPLSRQIRATTSGNTVSFTLTKPVNLYVEVEGKPREPVFIFANPPEVDVPTASTPNVIYFGPGLTDLGTTPLKVNEGQTVYLAGGAYVKGRIIAGNGLVKLTEDEKGKTNADPAVIRGRGILSGIGIKEKRKTFSQYMISGKDLVVEGITVTDSPGPLCICNGKLNIENVKLFSWAMCSDGIHGGAGSLVKNCFLKVSDDNIHFHSTAMKAIDNTLWIQQFGSALMLGWNVKESVDGQIVDGLDIIGDDPGRTNTEKDYLNCNVVSLRDMHNKAIYKNVVIANVRHESKPYQLFGVRTMLATEDKGHASYREGRGGINGMIIKNMTVAKMPLHKSIFDGNGTDPGSIENVTFENVQIEGIQVTESNSSTYIIQRGKTSGFQFKP
jgi:hypothetical protein